MHEAARLRQQLDFAHRMAKQRIDFVALPVEALKLVMAEASVERLRDIAASLAKVGEEHKSPCLGISICGGCDPNCPAK